MLLDTHTLSCGRMHSVLVCVVSPPLNSLALPAAEEGKGARPSHLAALMRSTEG